jgi:isoleucyl-tRNA synthetase
VKPELKALGPKLGKDLPKVRAALAEGRFTRRDGMIVVEGHELAPNEVLVSHEGEAGHTVARESGLVVALDTALTPELEAEGLARELAHKLNDLRKEAGFDIADRIALRYDGDIAAVVDRYRDTIAEETLASSVTRGLAGRGHAWSGELNGVAAQLEIEKT